MKHLLKTYPVRHRNLQLHRTLYTFLDKTRRFFYRLRKWHLIDRICRDDRRKNITGSGALRPDFMRPDYFCSNACFITVICDKAALYNSSDDNFPWSLR